MRRLFPNLLLATISVLLLSLLVEGVLRVIDYPGLPHRRPDFETGFRLMAGAHYRITKEGGSEGHISSKGIRDFEYPYEKPWNTYRILVMGDSYTEAMQVSLWRTAS